MTSNGTNGFSAVTNAHSDYGKRFRRLNDELANCGISNYIDTPTISILGSQSTGKSSVLEALSEIAFPRASGTCTRCPTEVRLFNAPQDWTCKVSLRLERDAKGQALPKPLNVEFGSPLQDKNEVQDRIRAAQRAILNPSKDPLSFINTKIKPEQNVQNEIGFSENTICLDVRGRNLVDLSLIDLPGIISNTGGAEDEMSVQLIKDLVTKTISKPNCLILMTITMTDDYQNQVGVAFAKQADPNSQRTLGVLTKADAVQKADLPEWLPIVEGNKFPLLHGYYVVRNPNSAELKEGIKYETARKREEEFFGLEPWRSMNPNTNQRLGSKKLGKQLGKLLEKLIQEKLPQTIDKIRLLSAETNDALMKLPKEVTEGASIHSLHGLLVKLSNHLQGQLSGKKDPKVFALPLKMLVIVFREKFFESRPLFFPFTASERENLKLSKIPSKDIFVDKETTDDYESAQHSKPEDQDGKISEIVCKGRVFKMSVNPLVLDLSDIQDQINSRTLERLPGNVPWEVKEYFMTKAVAQFEEFSNNILHDTIIFLKGVAKKVAVEHFGTYNGSPICTRISEILIKLIDEEGKKCGAFLESLHQCEAQFIHSLNFHYFSAKKSDYRDRAIDIRIKKGLHGNIPDLPFLTGSTEEADMKKFLSNQGFNVENLGQLSKHKVPVDITEQIEVAAEVRAYWQVAYKRFADCVRAYIDVHLVKPIGEKCLDRLCEQMGIYGSITPGKAHALLRESDDVRFKRDDLMTKRQRLDSALEQIEKFQNGEFDLEENGIKAMQ